MIKFRVFTSIKSGFLLWMNCIFEPPFWQVHRMHSERFGARLIWRCEYVNMRIVLWPCKLGKGASTKRFRFQLCQCWLLGTAIWFITSWSEFRITPWQPRANISTSGERTASLQNRPKELIREGPFPLKWVKITLCQSQKGFCPESW